jgi:spore maturation protein CgeB
MRIFVAVRHSNDPSQFYGSLWSENFYPALRQAGHEIVESQTDLQPASRFMDVTGALTPEEQAVRARLTESILEEIRLARRSGPIDLLLSYFYNAHFDPAGFDEVRRLGVPSVNFYCNSIHQFSLVAEIAAKADHSWFPERDAREKYLAAGARPVWVQMAADPDLCRPHPEIARQPRACFVGQRYADRDRWAAALLAAGVPVDLYGSGWSATAAPASASNPSEEADSYLGRRQYRPGSLAAYRQAFSAEIREQGVVSGTARFARQWQYRADTARLTPALADAAKGRASALSRTLAEYEVVLNFSNVWSDGHPGSDLIPHVRLRDFEGPMSRTCYLTGHTGEIEGCYEIGREIDTYRTAEELADKTRFYLANPAAAEALRDAGYRRARRDHTWRQRFDELFRRLDLAA